MGGNLRLAAVAFTPVLGDLPFSLFDNDSGTLYSASGGVLLKLAPPSIQHLPRNPRLSPDRSLVAFLDFTAADASAGLYVVPTDGSAATGDLDTTYRVWTDGPGGGHWAQTPSWRPDGGAIVFTSAAPDGGSYIGGTNGGKIMHVTYPGGVETTLWTPQVQSPTQREEGWRPIYSPDGTKIAFFVNIMAGGGGTFSRQGLWVMNADGSSPTLIDNWDSAASGGGYGYWGTQADWSHDSEWIAYVNKNLNASGTGANQNLYKIRPNGTDKTTLYAGPSTGAVWMGWGAWTDDDTGVRCAAFEPGSGNFRSSLFLAAADGSGAVEIRNGTGINDGPFGAQNMAQAWTLDDRMYFVTDDNPAILYSVALDGTDLQVYYDGTVDGFNLAGGVEWN